MPAVRYHTYTVYRRKGEGAKRPGKGDVDAKLAGCTKEGRSTATPSARFRLASAADPYGLNIMAANRAFHQLFFAREDIQHAFLHKRTAHMILAALCVVASLRILLVSSLTPW